MSNNVDEEEEAKERKAAWPRIHSGMLGLQPQQKMAFYEACERAPELVAKESDPVRFLRFEKFDSRAAARRIANYWTLRKELFGERAYLSMDDISGEGALSSEDLQALRAGYLQHLPADDKGRSVFAFDRSKLPMDIMPSTRVNFFGLQVAMYNDMSQEVGYVCLADMSNPFSASVSPSELKHHQAALEKAMPVKIYQIHFICRPPNARGIQFFLETIVSWALQRARPILGELFALTVATPDEDLPEKLLPYGLRRDGLPACFGGTWTAVDTMWQREGANSHFEIDPDISCLIQNALWTHAQAAELSDRSNQECSTDRGEESTKKAARGERNGITSDEACPQSVRARNPQSDVITEPAPGGSKRKNSSPALTGIADDQCQNHRKPGMKDLLGTSNGTGSALSPHFHATLHQEDQPQAIRKSISNVKPTKCMGGSRTKRQSYSSDQVPIKSRIDDDERMSLTAAAHIKEGEDEESRKRRRDAVHSRRKRERKRIETQVLEQEFYRLSCSNSALKGEQDRLEGLLEAAQKEIEMHETGRP